MVGIRVVLEWKKSRSFLHLVSRSCVIEIFSSEQTKHRLAASQLVVHSIELSFVYHELLVYFFSFSPSAKVCWIHVFYLRV
jgi:hypothetical protein